MKKNEIIYSLNKSDIQTVAVQELERKLSSTEIELVKNSIVEKINWFEIIADSINENIWKKAEL